ncbi:aminotransferase class I/II-fold pyridoxal phosphate-dependent enzyme [Sporosarcina sp. CAU 1771]
MTLAINKSAEAIKISGIRDLSGQALNYPNAINLTIGQPDFPTPEIVKQAGIDAIKNNHTGYSHFAGLAELRQAVASFFEDKYGFSYNPEDEIVITNGASEAIDSTFRTLLSPGDEVILPTPLYLGYEPIIELCGAKVVHLDTSDTAFIPSPERLESLITSKTKAILFNYPSNPTGMTLTKEQMDALVAVLEKHELFVLSDEIYSENVFSGNHNSFGQYKSIRDRFFLIHGLSKSHSMTGWRIGYVMGPAKLMEHVKNVHLYNSVCASVPGQHAGVVALNECRGAAEEMNKEYIKRRDYVYGRLTKMGLETIKPNGAFYIFPSIKKFGLGSYDFAIKLLKEGDVAVVPGVAFGNHAEGHIRITYAYAMPLLEEGMDRLEKFVKGLKN